LLRSRRTGRDTWISVHLCTTAVRRSSDRFSLHVSRADDTFPSRWWVPWHVGRRWRWRITIT